MVQLTARQLEIFRAIVIEFIHDAMPVGSKYLIRKYRWPYSSATVRNEMSQLEELGLLEKTHTSSGRIPSTKGYQYYTQYVMEADEQDHQKMAMTLNRLFTRRSQSVEEALKQSVDILSQMTQLTTGVLGGESVSQTLAHIDVIEFDETQAIVIFETNLNHRESKMFSVSSPLTLSDLNRYVSILNDRLVDTPMSEVLDKMESLRPILQENILRYEYLFEAFASAFVKFASNRMYFSGKNNLLNYPEFNSPEKMKDLLDMLENSSMWQQICAEQASTRIQTSAHSQTIWKDDMAIITSDICLGAEEVHQLMVVGPSRMHYSKVVTMVEYIAKMIEDVYGKKGE